VVYIDTNTDTATDAAKEQQHPRQGLVMVVVVASSDSISKGTKCTGYKRFIISMQGCVIIFQAMPYMKQTSTALLAVAVP
jgi:hypothetical protein